MSVLAHRLFEWFYFRMKACDMIKKHLYALLFTFMNIVVASLIGYGLLSSNDAVAVLLLLGVIVFFMIGRRYKQVQLHQLRKEQASYYDTVHIPDRKSFYYPIRICYWTSIYTLIVYILFELIINRR